MNPNLKDTIVYISRTPEQKFIKELCKNIPDFLDMANEATSYGFSVCSECYSVWECIHEDHPSCTNCDGPFLCVTCKPTYKCSTCNEWYCMKCLIDGKTHGTEEERKRGFCNKDLVPL